MSENASPEVGPEPGPEVCDATVDEVLEQVTRARTATDEHRFTDSAAASMDGLEAADRMIARWQSVRTRLLATASANAVAEAESASASRDRALEFAMRSLTAEVAAVSHESETSASVHLEHARFLHRCLPHTLRAHVAGELSTGRAEIIAEFARRLEWGSVLAEYERILLADAAERTAGSLRRRAKHVAEQLMADDRAERHARARRGRSVRITSTDDGMAVLEATVDVALARAIDDRLTEMAKAVAGPDLPVTHAQLRADVLTDLLLTADPAEVAARGGHGPHTAAHGIQARLSVTIPMLSLLGHDSDVATVDGVEPISLDTARRLTQHVPSMLRILTDPVTGRPLATDRRLASREQRDFLAVRDAHCRFPGCSRVPARCDADHTVDWAHGGPTSIRNLALLCKRHHTLKHLPGWRVRQLDDGELEWTSPAGRVYSTHADQPGPVFRPHEPQAPPELPVELGALPVDPEAPIDLVPGYRRPPGCELDPVDPRRYARNRVVAVAVDVVELDAAPPF